MEKIARGEKSKRQGKRVILERAGVSHGRGKTIEERKGEKHLLQVEEDGRIRTVSICRDSIVMAWTANTGNPRDCWNQTADIICVPANLMCGQGPTPARAGSSQSDYNPGSANRTIPQIFIQSKYPGQVGINLADNLAYNTTCINFDTGGCWQVGFEFFATPLQIKPFFRRFSGMIW